MTLYVVGMGANLGAREGAFRAAIDLIEEGGDAQVESRSRLYDTAPVGPPQPRFLNAALRVRTDASPEGFLDRLLGIERALGRERAREVRWGPRTLDLDLLWGSVGGVRSARLTLPHPRLGERAFALAPLLDVAPPEVVRAWGPRLESLGPPPPSEAFDDPEPTSSEEPGAVRYQVWGRDRADALAALGAIDGPSAGEPAGATVSLTSDAGPEGLGVPLTSLLARGHTLRWLAVPRFEGRTVGAIARLGRREGPPRRVRSLELTPVSGRFRADLVLERLGP